jgi:phosphohistidine phosphatase
MYLYLIRHGIAIDRDALSIDEFRPLTKLGRKKVAQVADKLVGLDLKFDLIVTSPLVRARQTADILIDKQLSHNLEVSTDLAPGGNIQSWIADWDQRSTVDPISTLALVGHEPDLSEWAELFIFGKVYHQLILKKGGIIGLKFPAPAEHQSPQIEIGKAQLHCLIPPKYLM